MPMTLKEFAALLDGRTYLHEITEEEEALARELGYVVVFGYSDDNAELRGAIDDEIGCYDGGVIEHEYLQGTILAQWCPDDVDCSWYFSSTLPYENFYIYEGNDLYCVGAVIDNKKAKPTNADRIRAMSDAEMAEWLARTQVANVTEALSFLHMTYSVDDESKAEIKKECLEWLQQPAEES